jgi:hypothetical protein
MAVFEVDSTIKASPEAGFFKFVFPLMKPLVARDGPKQAHNFAQFVEARSATS